MYCNRSRVNGVAENTSESSRFGQQDHANPGTHRDFGSGQSRVVLIGGSCFGLLLFGRIFVLTKAFRHDGHDQLAPSCLSCQSCQKTVSSGAGAAGLFRGHATEKPSGSLFETPVVPAKRQRNAGVAHVAIPWLSRASTQRTRIEARGCHMGSLRDSTAGSGKARAQKTRRCIAN